MENKFINKVNIGFDSAEGSDKLACSLIIVCENEKELQEKVKIASAAPALLDACIKIAEYIELHNISDGEAYFIVKNAIKKATE